MTLRARRSDSKQTSDSILEVAIKLFAENGYDRTSMRAIADAAGVNIASANYHYGSKQNLFEAAFKHCAAPINDARYEQLTALQKKTTEPSVEQIVRAFINVGIAEQANKSLAQLAARIFVEPKNVARPLLDQVFGPVISRFVDSLHVALPNVSKGELEWRFHFLVGAMLQLIRFDTPLTFSGSAAKEMTPEQKFDELVHFVSAGLRQS